MNYIDKLRQKLEQIERKIKSIYRITKEKTKIYTDKYLEIFGIEIIWDCRLCFLYDNEFAV